ncbi:MAG: DUF58 domain-containing protein [Clostridia bacterium]|nr:DUF58 domain-containing protein [Clostridia bacterium]
MTVRLAGVLAAMATLLLVTLSTGGRMYFLLFLVLSLMTAAGLASTLWTLFTLRTEYRGVKERAKRGSVMATAFTVRHTSLLPAGSLRLSVMAPSPGARLQEVTVTSPPFVARTFRHTLPCPHRGIYQAGVVRVTAMDAFGLFRFSRSSGLPLVQVEVFPEPEQTGVLPLGSADMGPEYIVRSTEDISSPSDLRSWQPGDSLKKVHWKLSLRKRELVVRTYEEGARPDTLILPDLSEIVALRDQRLTLEDAVCECALGAAKAQLEAGYPVSMPLVSARPAELSARNTDGLGAFTDALMRVRFDAPRPYDQVLMMMLARMQRVGGVILVTARLNARAADIAVRIVRMGVPVRLILVSDDLRDQAGEMEERLRMSGIALEKHDPGKRRAVRT